MGHPEMLALHPQMSASDSHAGTDGVSWLQVIISALINYAMLGLVYARFSNPVQRALTLRFGRSMTLTTWGEAWRLSFRVANLRKHQASLLL